MHKIKSVGDKGSSCLAPLPIENFSDEKLLLAILHTGIVYKVFNHLRTVDLKQYFTTTLSTKSQLSKSKALQIPAVKMDPGISLTAIKSISIILSPICLPSIKAFWPGRINSLR